MNSTAPGNNYYQSLLPTSSPYKKQILLDLYRTMPSNKYFRLEGLGVSSLSCGNSARCIFTLAITENILYSFVKPLDIIITCMYLVISFEFLCEANFC